MPNAHRIVKVRLLELERLQSDCEEDMASIRATMDEFEYFAKNGFIEIRGYYSFKQAVRRFETANRQFKLTLRRYQDPA